MRKLLIFVFSVFLPSALLADDVWTGDQPIDWSKGQGVTIGPSAFASAKVNDVLKFKIKFTGNAQWQQLLLYNGAGTPLTDASEAVVSPSITKVRYTITPGMLAEMKRIGVIVTGKGFALTGVQIVPSSEVAVFQASVPVKHDWQWFTPEKPTIDVIVTNPDYKNSEAHVELTILTEKMQYCITLEKTATVGAGATTTFTFAPELEPGFYQCSALVNDVEARTFIFGVDPDKITCPPDMQPDFGAFWYRKKSELAAVPMDFKLSQIPSRSTVNRTVYLLEVRSLDDPTGEVFMRAYYAEPNEPGKYPALIHYCGYDMGNVTPYCMSGDDMPGFLEMYVSIRGQFINNRTPYTNPYGNYFYYGFGNLDNYYYTGAYMDALRAVDFICSREKAEPSLIFAEGSSQGGALSIAAAALSDGRVKAIATGVPSMADFPDNFQMMSWVANAAAPQSEVPGMDNAEVYRFLSYFDMKNLATMVGCPIYMNYSLQDELSSPHANWAFLNNTMSKVKKVIVNATGGHETADNWTEEQLKFFYSLMSPTVGDVNGDRIIDVADVAAIIGVMSGMGGMGSESADVNGDGVVDVADVSTIITIMAGNQE